MSGSWGRRADRLFLRGRGRILGQNEGDVVMRARDDLHADDTSPTVRAACAPASVAALTAATSPMTTARDEGVADLLHGAGQRDIRGLEHGIDVR
jgi:hypothetical protein